MFRLVLTHLIGPSIVCIIPTIVIDEIYSFVMILGALNSFKGWINIITANLIPEFPFLIQDCKLLISMK